MGEQPDPRIRVGDADRERALQALWQHLEAGRLKTAEHEERCAHARVASTRADIEALFADLPAPHPDLSGVVHPPKAPDEPTSVSDTLAGVGFVALLLGLTAAIILTVRDGMWWTFFPAVALPTAIWVVSDMVERREKRPAADDPVS